MGPGDRVCILAPHGTPLHGKQATVLKFDAGLGTYAVALDGVPELLHVEPARLHPHSSPLAEAKAALNHDKAAHGAFSKFLASWDEQDPPPAAELVAAQASEAKVDLTQQQEEHVAALRSRLCKEAERIRATAHEAPAGLLDLESLGSARPPAPRPFACAVRISVRGLSVAAAIEQGEAVVAEVVASYHRGPVGTSTRQLRPGAQHFVMWANLGKHSLLVQPNKSNGITWLSKAKAWVSDLDPRSSWPAQRALVGVRLPHAAAWLRVLELARDDGGIDIKDDCRLEDRSARCHQDGNNAVAKGHTPLVRLAVNVSSAASGRSLDYLEMAADKRFVDGAERESLLVATVSQDAMWHGAAQTTAGYVEGITQY